MNDAQPDHGNNSINSNATSYEARARAPESFQPSAEQHRDTSSPVNQEQQNRVVRKAQLALGQLRQYAKGREDIASATSSISTLVLGEGIAWDPCKIYRSGLLSGIEHKLDSLLAMFEGVSPKIYRVDHKLMERLSNPCHDLCEFLLEKGEEELNYWVLEAINEEGDKLAGCVMCLLPDERRQATKAHTVSKHEVLKKLVKHDGDQMYELKMVYTKPENPGSRLESDIEAGLVGIGQASTFRGLCNYHDKEYAPVDQGYPTHIDQKKLFLLAKRQACYEMYKYTAGFRGFSLLSDTFGIQYRPPLDHYEARMKETQLRLDELEAIQTIEDYDKLGHLFFRFPDSKTLFANSNTWGLEADLEQGRDKPINGYITAYPDRGDMIVFITCPTGQISQLAEKFPCLLVEPPDEELEVLISSLFLKDFFNLYFNRESWDKIKDQEGKTIIRNMKRERQFAKIGKRYMDIDLNDRVNLFRN